MKPPIGVIGGIGQTSTMKFLQQITKMTIYNKNNKPLFFLNNSRIPNRTNAILNHDTKDVSKYLIDIAKKIEKNNCKFIVMPSNIAHYWANDIINSINIPFINMIDETMKVIHDYNYKSITVLATKGTVYSKIYENSANNYNIKINYPNEENIKRLQQIIDSIKSNNYDRLYCTYLIYKIINETNSECVILGCDEFSSLTFISNNIFDPFKILSKTTIKLWNN
jgi:aspartate racemase